METNNYACLCRLIVDVGFQALKETFDKLHPNEDLHRILKRPPAHPTLQTLRQKKIISAAQWRKLYPGISSSVSSANFDIALLILLLKNICGLSPPATGWDSLPQAADTSLEANIARVTYYRNKIYELHASHAPVDDSTFNAFWQEISNVLVQLGAGVGYWDSINLLKTERLDSDFVEHYQELVKEWKRDDDSTKDILEEMESMNLCCIVLCLKV